MCAVGWAATPLPWRTFVGCFAPGVSARHTGIAGKRPPDTAVGGGCTIAAVADDTEQLEALERELLRPETRSDRARMRALLHPEFVEIGRSGRVWSADEVIDLFPDGPPAGRLVAAGFGVAEVARGCMLVT